MHPAGDFLGNIETDLSSVLYLDSIISAYQLTGFDRSLIKKHGFMVTERLTRSSSGSEVFNTSLRIFDITGKEVTTILSVNLQPGNYMTQWTGTDSYCKQVSSGVYILVLSSGNMTANHKITLLK